MYHVSLRGNGRERGENFERFLGETDPGRKKKKQLASDHAIRRWVENERRSETIIGVSDPLRKCSSSWRDDRGEKCCKLETIKAETLRAGDD